MTNRRTFSREFKLEAVRLVEERGVSATQAARDLDVHLNVLRTWVKKLGPELHGGKGVPPTVSERAEIQQLRRENAKLKMERDILKKAAAWFAKESL
jgi:transposase